MRAVSGDPDDLFDVVVVGSGASGLTAALRAAEAGASVAVLEKSEYLGGTSALSGGMLWLPGNGLPNGNEPDSDREDARRYLEQITFGRANPELLDQHIAQVPALLSFLAEHGLEFDVINAFPDYEAEMDGGRAGGRSVEPRLFDTAALGDLASALRPDPRPPFRQCEYFEEWKSVRNMPLAQLAQRAKDGIVARGQALIAPLVAALGRLGATLVVECPGERLLTEVGRISGVRAGGREFHARAGVVLAAGGFEWNDEMVDRFLSGPVQTRCGTPHNVGDGHRMGMAVGADLAGMNEAWWGVMADLPGLEVDGRPVGQLFTLERCLPGTLIVNRRGERFMNEGKSYYGIGKLFATWDQVTYGYRNLPCYLVGDGRFLSAHGILGNHDVATLPPAIACAPTLGELADILGVDAAGLEATVARFNSHARDGRDPDFRRGESAYEHYLGDHSAPHPNLAPLEDPPFVAIEVRAGAIGTKGGIRTDADGRALDPFGEVIPGLFAVGNNSAHPFAFGYAGAGSTLGPGMTMAYVAGHTAAGALVQPS